MNTVAAESLLTSIVSSLFEHNSYDIGKTHQRMVEPKTLAKVQNMKQQKDEGTFDNQVTMAAMMVDGASADEAMRSLNRVLDAHQRGADISDAIQQGPLTEDQLDTFLAAWEGLLGAAR